MGTPDSDRSRTSRYTVRSETSSASARNRAVAKRRARSSWTRRKRRSARRNYGPICSFLRDRVETDTVALAVDELGEVAHAVGKLRLGNRDRAAIGGRARERSGEILSRAEIHHAALARGLVSVGLHDAAGIAGAFVGKHREVRRFVLVARELRLEDLFVETDRALEIGGGNLEPHGDVLLGAHLLLLGSCDMHEPILRHRS